MSGSTLITEQKLIVWGKWSRMNNPLNQLNYKSAHQALMAQNVGGGIAIPPTPDDDAMVTDAIVSRLKTKDEKKYKVLVMYFIYKYSYRKIAEKAHIKKHEVEKELGSAISWVDGAYDNLNQKNA